MVRKKKNCFASLLLIITLVSTHAAFGEDLSYARGKTTGLDIELSQVNILATVHDEKCIAYRYELAEEKKLSCIETQKTLRIRQMSPSQGTLYLFIPKTMLLENCSIRINRADITLEDLQAVHVQLMLNRGACTVKTCTFKNAAINLAQGTLSIDNTQIIKSCAYTLTDAIADIAFPSAQNEYHIDYVKNKAELTIADTQLEKNAGEYGNHKAKRRIIFSGSAVKASIRFKKASEH